MRQSSSCTVYSPPTRLPLGTNHTNPTHLIRDPKELNPLPLLKSTLPMLPSLSGKHSALDLQAAASAMAIQILQPYSTRTHGRSCNCDSHMVCQTKCRA
jgi:hypothetical protein